MRLWRELHPNDPVQLQLIFRNADKKEKSEGFVEEMTAKVQPLLALPDAHTPELIGALADQEESEYRWISHVERNCKV
jgi:hypothetical protein